MRSIIYIRKLYISKIVETNRARDRLYIYDRSIARSVLFLQKRNTNNSVKKKEK